MSDRTLTWFVPGVLSQNVEGTNVSTEYVLDENYVPVRVVIRQKVAQGSDPTIIDINDDGVSIFGTPKPAVAQGLPQTDWDVFERTLTMLEKDSIITLDVDQVSGTIPGEALTVHLELNRE